MKIIEIYLRRFGCPEEPMALAGLKEGKGSWEIAAEILIGLKQAYPFIPCIPPNEDSWPSKELTKHRYFRMLRLSGTGDIEFTQIA